MLTYWAVAALVGGISWYYLKEQETWVEPALAAVFSVVLGLLWFVALPLLLARVLWTNRENVKNVLSRAAGFIAGFFKRRE